MTRAQLDARLTAAAVRVDLETLWRDILALGDITDPARPYTRRSFSPLFLAGRRWLTQRMQEAGLTTHIDAAGNLVGRLAGSGVAARTLIVGSHSDSVPSGGRFDGMAGVIAGIAIARTLTERGIALRHSLEIVDFLAEEPNEFGLSCIGSRGMTGNLSTADLALRNTQQETLGEALVRMGGRPAELGTRRTDVEAAFELHIEQGPVLESEGLDIGIVTAIVGIMRLEIQFVGTAGHAGTTPMTQRRDPLLAAAHLVGWVRKTADALAARDPGHFVATVGLIEALPGATNVIPKSARILVDARSEDPRLTEEFRRALEAESLAAASAANVDRVAFNIQSSTLPAACDAGLQNLLASSAGKLGYSRKSMASGAGHDMAFLSQIAPMAMVFIPCMEGRSHTPEEWADPSALERGTNVLLAAILRLDAGEAGGQTLD